jgi:hypothetical protein
MNNISFEELLDKKEYKNMENNISNEEENDLILAKNQLIEELESIKKTINEKINFLAKETSEIRKMSETMIYLVSTRQEVIDKMIDKKNILIDMINIKKSYYKKYYEEEFKNNPLKISFKLREELINVKLKDIDSMIESIELFIEYLVQSLKTIDALIFFSKDRLELYKQIGS